MEYLLKAQAHTHIDKSKAEWSTESLTTNKFIKRICHVSEVIVKSLSLILECPGVNTIYHHRYPSALLWAVSWLVLIVVLVFSAQMNYPPHWSWNCVSIPIGNICQRGNRRQYKQEESLRCTMWVFIAYLHNDIWVVGHLVCEICRLLLSGMVSHLSRD